MITKIRSGEIPPPSLHNFECPDELDAIVLRALARDREDRWQDAAQIRTALDRLRPQFTGGPPQVVQWKEQLIPPAPRTRYDTVVDGIAEGSVRQPSRANSVEITAVRPREEATRNELPSGRAVTHDDDDVTTLDATISRSSTDD